MFLEGLKAIGKNWRDISTVLQARTPAQMRTHAQKFFVKMVRNETRAPSCKGEPSWEYTSLKKGTTVLVSCLKEVQCRNLEHEVLEPGNNLVSLRTRPYDNEDVKTENEEMICENQGSNKSKSWCENRNKLGRSSPAKRVKVEDSVNGSSGLGGTTQLLPFVPSGSTWMMFRSDEESYGDSVTEASYTSQRDVVSELHMVEALDLLLEEAWHEV